MRFDWENHIKTLAVSNGKIDYMHDQIGNFIREIETIRKKSHGDARNKKYINRNEERYLTNSSANDTAKR
jgi:hypothetical protein